MPLREARLLRPARRRVLVVLPTYNERDNLGPITNGILAATSDVDVLIVDDNSPDGTGRLADEITAREKRVRVLENVVGRRVGGGNARMVYARFAVLRPKAMSRIAPAPICLAA